jgi:hypothetical protein
MVSYDDNDGTEVLIEYDPQIEEELEFEELPNCYQHAMRIKHNYLYPIIRDGEEVEDVTHVGKLN